MGLWLVVLAGLVTAAGGGLMAGASPGWARALAGTRHRTFRAPPARPAIRGFDAGLAPGAEAVPAGRRVRGDRAGGDPAAGGEDARRGRPAHPNLRARPHLAAVRAGRGAALLAHPGPQPAGAGGRGR